MTMTVLLDLVVAGLLIAAIAYCVMLNRRLAALRADRAELDQTVRTLADVSMRAENGIGRLKETAEQVGRQLQEKVERAETLRDDLTYMVDRAGSLADKLEVNIRNRREEPQRGRGEKPIVADREEAPGALQGRLRDLLRRIEPEAEAASAAKDESEVAGFPSRAERELRRALDGRRR
jgi:chromosome segregation ATPase